MTSFTQGLRYREARDESTTNQPSATVMYVLLRAVHSVFSVCITI